MPCTPGMRRCRADCRHRRLVDEYRIARHAAELAREAVTGAYAAELDDYGPIITFKAWLEAYAGQGEAS